MTGPAGPADYFQEVHETFRRARRSAGPGVLDMDYDIAGQVVRLCFANPVLVPILAPAFEHLRAEPVSSPALTLCVFDLESTRAGLPPGPWPEDAPATGAQWLYDDGTLRLHNQAGEALSLFDSALGVGIYCVPSARTVPWYESGSPFRVILHWWSGTCSRRLVHAAAVGTASGAVLVGGKSGSGKSTTALTCLEAGLDYLGDDYVMVSATPSPAVYSLYSVAKLDPDNAYRFPKLKGSVSPRGNLYPAEKVLVFLARGYRERLKPSLPLRAIIIPRLAGRRQPAVQRLSPAAALAALAPSTMFQLPGDGGAVLETMGQLVRELPAYVLELSPDMSGVPALIAKLVA